LVCVVTDGALNVVPLTPVPLHITLVTEVPAGNVAINAAAVPEQSGPTAVKVGAGAAATVIVIEPVTRQPLTVALKFTVYVPIMEGAVNMFPLTPVPLHTTLVTVVPAGNVAVSVAVEPGHNVPIEPKIGVGTVATVIVMLAVIGQPFTVALKFTV
jgi:hypothetical protein